LLLALLAGLGAGLAHPPFGVLPGLIGFTALMWSVDHAGPHRPIRSAALRGLVAGFGFFLVSLWWVAEAFFVDAAAHGWMAPIVMAILPTGMALFWAGACALYKALRVDGLKRAFVFAACFGLFEWIRGHVLTGFPWNLAGETWAAGSAPSQAAALIGSYGLSVVTVAMAALLAVALGQEARRTRLTALALSAGVLAGLYGFGTWRLSQPAPPDQSTRVRIVQADIDQGHKWRPENLDGVLNAYLGLTRSPGRDRADIVIWPEGAIPSAANDYLGADEVRRKRVAAALRPGQILLTGAFRVEPAPDRPDGVRAYNTLLGLRQVAGDLQLLTVYDKHRLVPLGEFLPLRRILEPIGFVSLVHAPADFTPGPRPAPIEAPGLPRVQPLICYESLFPGFTSDEGGRPSWIVNPSNDSWFGKTSGPWQHLNIMGHRAIEEGLPVIRSTPTGVSAVIDAHGRTREALGIGAAGVIDAPIPGALPTTLYARFGETGFWILTIGGLLLGLPLRRLGVRR
jgi:apolipoprotein N-acyltransferase